MSLSRCIDIEINGVQYPFHFGMSTILKFLQQKKAKASAIKAINMLLSEESDFMEQIEFFSLALQVGCKLKDPAMKYPGEVDIADHYLTILKAASDTVMTNLTGSEPADKATEPKEI